MKALAADECIANSSPNLSGVIHAYCRFYPDDMFLIYWAGLVLKNEKKYIAATKHFINAAISGLNQQRIIWNMVELANIIGQNEIASTMLEILICEIPYFVKGQEMAKKLAASKKKTNSPEAPIIGSHIFILSLLMNNIKEKETIARLSLKLIDNNEAFEACYHAGLAFHKKGDLHRAQIIYQHIYNEKRVTTTLAAWALFKHGEIMMELGDKTTAIALWEQTLERNPSHVKAALYLTPDTKPLKVHITIQPDKIDDHITVPMDALNRELWSYYFSFRCPDQLIISLEKDISENEKKELNELILKYLASGGKAKINFL
ncbi:MAG: hypothetical protein HQK65_08755 [Desulfamplus sp.]|nr:hypothetical protein [Desulfamplus sp.]